MATANENKNGSSQNNISKENITDQGPSDTIKQNRKDQARIKTFFKSDHVRGWVMIIVTGTLALLAFLQWQVMNGNLKQTRDLVTESQKQVTVAQASADAAKTSADAAKKNAEIAEQSLSLERSKTKAKLECRMWERRLFVTVNDFMTLSDSVSVSISDSTGVHERTDTSTKDDHIQVAAKQTETSKPAPTITSNEDERTEVILICLNQSSRPTAIIDVYLRDNNGNHLGRIPRGYNNQIKLPFSVGSWGVTPPINFRIEKSDDEKMKDLFIMDMENKGYVIPCPSTRPRQ